MFFIFFNFESHKYYHSQKLCHNIFYRCQSKHVPLTKNMLKVYYIKIIFYLNFQRYFFLFFQNCQSRDKKPIYSKEERQAIITKKKEIRLKRKNRKKAILLNIAQLPPNFHNQPNLTKNHFFVIFN